MQVRDVMETRVQTVKSKTPVAEFESKAIELNVSGFPVVDAGKLVGVVSRSDVVRALEVERTYEDQLSDFYGPFSPSVEDDSRQRGSRIGARVEGMTVDDVMSKDVITVEADQPLAAAARLLVENGIHRLPVTDKGAMIGIVTTLDITRAVAEGKLAEV